MIRPLPLLCLLTACASGDWVVTSWGEEYIEEGIPAADFADGCAATFTTFTVAVAEATLLDGDGADAHEPLVPGQVELTAPGPHPLGRVAAPRGTYDTARFVIAPDASGVAVHTAGTLACGAQSVGFDWAFATDTTYLCEPAGLTLPAGGEATTELTVHGDHLFYDGLEDPEAAVRGQALVDADVDGDGALTLVELGAVPVAPLGYTVGRYSEVATLADFVTHLTRTLGHVDGEGHCAVSL